MDMHYDEATVHQLEQELGTKIYPGTEVMRDVGSVHFVKSSAHHRVLVPQPSADPADPLNWSRPWKIIAISLATAVSFTQGLGPLALAPMFPQLMAAFDAGLADVVQFTGVCILVLGFSNFFWVPVQEAFGRRPVLIFSTIICMASCIWRATATTYSGFMGACILNGIGAGPAETAQPTIVADVLFLHERGAFNTLYFTFYFGALMVGPIIAGPMADHVGWRSFWWLNVGVLGLTSLLLIFLFPETRWDRSHATELANRAAAQIDSTDSIKGPLAVEVDKVATKETSPDAVSDDGPQDPHLGKGKPAKWQFKIIQTSGAILKTLWMSFFIPWKLHLFPIVLFAAFVVSWSASCFLTLNLTQSAAFAAPPYNFNSQTIGFFNFAILVGALIGLFTNGWLSDWVSAQATKRNRGVREPEMRLLAMIPYVLIMILGNFISAFGYEKHWDWRVIVIIGWTCAGIQVAALPALASTYAVDSYKPVAGPLFVTITVNKNLWGYGFSVFIIPWVEKSGFVKPIMTNMGLTVLWCLMGVPLYFWGKKLRGLTKNSSVHRM